MINIRPDNLDPPSPNESYWSSKDIYNLPVAAENKNLQTLNAFLLYFEEEQMPIIEIKYAFRVKSSNVKISAIIRII